MFSASYSGLFKTFVDVLEPGMLDGKPVLIAATGGTARHSLVLDHALRPLFSYLQAVVVPTGVFAASEDFGSTDEGHLDKRIRRAAGELAGLLGGDGTPSRPPRSGGPSRTSSPTRRRSRSCSAGRRVLPDSDESGRAHQRPSQLALVSARQRSVPGPPLALSAPGPPSRTSFSLPAHEDVGAAQADAQRDVAVVNGSARGRRTGLVARPDEPVVALPGRTRNRRQAPTRA